MGLSFVKTGPKRCVQCFIHLKTADSYVCMNIQASGICVAVCVQDWEWVHYSFYLTVHVCVYTLAFKCVRMSLHPWFVMVFSVNACVCRQVGAQPACASFPVNHPFRAPAYLAGGQCSTDIDLFVKAVWFIPVIHLMTNSFLSNPSH